MELWKLIWSMVVYPVWYKVLQVVRWDLYLEWFSWNGLWMCVYPRWCHRLHLWSAAWVSDPPRCIFKRRIQQKIGEGLRTVATGQGFASHFCNIGLLCGSALKESARNVGDLASISGLGRSPGEGKGYSLQYSCLKNSMDCIVHGVTELHMTEQISISLSLC